MCCRVHSDKTGFTSQIACCFWKATPMIQLWCSCCPSVWKFHLLIQQKKETRQRFLLHLWVVFSHKKKKIKKNMIKTTQVCQGSEWIDKSGMDRGGGERNLSLLLSENCYVSSPVSLVCPSKGCWHTTFVLSMLERIYETPRNSGWNTMMA